MLSLHLNLFVREIRKGMITEIKYFIIFLIFSMFPSELVHHPEEKSCFCKHQDVSGSNESSFFACLSEIKCSISEIKSSIIAKRVPENRDILTNYDEKKSDTYRNNEHKQLPFFIETSVRTVVWISIFKWNLQKLLASLIQKDIPLTELLPFQIYSNHIFIPSLTYYVYTLEEITI